MIKVLVLIGGISAGSLNRRFFAAVEKLEAEAGFEPGRDHGDVSGSGSGSGGDHGRGENSGSGSGGDHGRGEISGSGSGGFDFRVADIASLPFFSQDLEAAPPESVVAFRSLATSCEAVLLVTPEYNRSIPGVLKNALDWGSRPADKSVWTRKPTAIMGASSGAIGTFGAQQHLRNICSWLDMRVMNQPAVCFNGSTGMADASGKPDIAGDRLTEGSAAFMRTFLEAFKEWVALFGATHRK